MTAVGCSVDGLTGGLTIAARLGSTWLAQRGDDRRAQLAAGRERRSALHGPIVDFATAGRVYLNNIDIVAMMMTKSQDPLTDWIEYTETDSGKQLLRERERLNCALTELRQLLRDEQARKRLDAYDDLQQELGKQHADIQRRPRSAEYDEIGAFGAFLGTTAALPELTRRLEEHVADWSHECDRSPRSSGGTPGSPTRSRRRAPKVSAEVASSASSES